MPGIFLLAMKVVVAVLFVWLLTGAKKASPEQSFNEQLGELMANRWRSESISARSLAGSLTTLSQVIALTVGKVFVGICHCRLCRRRIPVSAIRLPGCVRLHRSPRRRRIASTHRSRNQGSESVAVAGSRNSAFEQASDTTGRFWSVSAECSEERSKTFDSDCGERIQFVERNLVYDRDEILLRSIPM
jgi:hypothetical protein